MGDSANVHSIDAVSQFAQSLRQFDDEVSRTLIGLDQQVNRALQWLDHDAPAYWQGQIRRCFDQVGETRVQLEMCKLRSDNGKRSSCIDEQKAHERAKRRLEEAQAKLNLVKQWGIRAHRGVDEFRGRIGALKHHLESDVPRTLALLERTVGALEAYAQRPMHGDVGAVQVPAATEQDGGRGDAGV